MKDSTPPTTDQLEIRSEPHGPHWIAWIPRHSDGKPEASVVLVAETRKEAEKRARAWAATALAGRPR
ncbi:MAG TPA: hypothetical protein VNE16_01155 [Vicinamibacterales bacterium]|nr:hypothetical protein [Vicinamibacterales bacterium]